MIFPWVARSAYVREQNANLDLIRALGRMTVRATTAEADAKKLREALKRPRGPGGRWLPMTTPAQAVDGAVPLTGVTTPTAAPATGVAAVGVPPRHSSATPTVATYDWLAPLNAPQDAVLTDDDPRDLSDDGA